MDDIIRQFAYAFRDFNTEGMASSGLAEVDKKEARALGPMIAAAIAKGTLAGVTEIVPTSAELGASTPAPASGLVFSDPDDAKNDFWVIPDGAADGAWENTNLFHSLIQADLIAYGAGSVKDALDELLYGDGLSIDSFTATPAIIETGGSATVNIAGAISGTVTGFSVTDSVDGAVTTSGTAASFTGSQAGVDSARTFTLSASNTGAPGGTDTKTATVSVADADKGHVGTINKSDGATLTSGEVNAMSQEWFATSITRTLNFTTDADGYLWYSHPASLADPSAFKVGGFVVSSEKTTRSHTTATGQTVSYNDFRLTDFVPSGTAILLEVIA